MDTVNYDAADLIVFIVRGRGLLRLAPRDRLRLSMDETSIQRRDNNKKSPCREASFQGTTSATGIASRLSVGLSPALTVTDCTCSVNPDKLAGSR
jgi:hypothetical protein